VQDKKATPRLEPVSGPARLRMRSDGLVVVVIETASHAGTKLKFDERLGVSASMASYRLK
jgi:hypothetical protein